MNLQKTKIMKNQFVTDAVKVDVEGTEIEEVEEYVYLGQLFRADGNKEHEIRRRINAGWREFGRAHLIFKSKTMPLIHKQRIFNQCILPAVCYGSETWSLTQKQTLKLRSMQRRMERIMVGVKLQDHQSAESIRKRTKVADILEHIYKRKWTWAGHIIRRSDERWTKRLTEWCPRNGTRTRGRPKKRWSDDLENFMGGWQRYPYDREYWKDLQKHFLQKCILGKPEAQQRA